MLTATQRRHRSHAAQQISDFVKLSSRRAPTVTGPIVLLTGAGVSTASGIPDYRGPQGLYERGHRPMTYQLFTSGREAQQRYFARSFLGYPDMVRRQPNPAHIACASLVRCGHVDTIVTQNVDGLHGDALRRWSADMGTNAGPAVCRSTESEEVLELHGNIHRIRCMECKELTLRSTLQHRLAEANKELLQRHPALAAAAQLPIETQPLFVSETAYHSTLEMSSEKPSRRDGVILPPRASSIRPQGDTEGPADDENSRDAPQRPDGDFAASQEWIDQFQIVPCAACGAFALKPDLVFFGESTAKHHVERAYRAVDEASCLLCVGTSMQVFSAYRFVRRAVERGVPVGILNSGATRADGDAVLKVDGPVEEVLPYVALQLGNKI